LQAHTFASLFNMPMSTLLQHARAAVPGKLSLWLPGGVAVSAVVDYRTRQATLVMPAATDDRDGAAHAIAQRPGKATRLSSLRYLDTGDAQLAQVIDRVTRLLGRDVPTLILGETGTGKELLAQAMHHDSPRADGPFVAVNCASIPEALMEAELFGYEEGAFTGARRKGSPGKIVQAHGGALFLDEIGDMPLSMQARLLRVLQERKVAPLGSTRLVDVDVNVVCATHRNLREMMANGSFRDDLYYRLNGLVVRLPALRERTDLAVIVARLLRSQQESDAGRGCTGSAVQVSPDVMALFATHGWPGNLRQLSNVLRTATLMAEGTGSVQVHHLPEDFLQDCDMLLGQGTAVSNAHSRTTSAPSDRNLGSKPGDDMPVRRLGDVTANALHEALAFHQGNVSAAARALGVSRNTVYRHLKAGR
ncbi:MAG: sigma-54-dependent Fis family transcriptional regulator, partial [Comamonadaceae bacterium]